MELGLHKPFHFQLHDLKMISYVSMHVTHTFHCG